MDKPIWTDTEIVNQLNSGYLLKGTNLTYGFPKNGNWFPFGERDGFSALNSAQKAGATLAIKLWDDLIVPDFTQAPNGAHATVKYSDSTTNIGYAHAYYPGGWVGASSVWFNPNYGANSGTNNLVLPAIGSGGWITYVHETGHALGLGHPGTYNGGAPTYGSDALYMQDSQMYTVMSYFTADNTGADWVASNGVTYTAQTPMLHDIAAVQAMYGVETTTRTGDTVYGFNSNVGGKVFDFAANPHPVLCIFDSAGIDTIDLSGWNTPSLINLMPGSFSNSDMMTYNISIANTTWIENAIGGGGGDTLIGNILANTLSGQGGDDNFTGEAGNDTILGGAGYDTIGFSGNFADYTISWNAVSGAYIVVDNRVGSPDGTDTVKEVENFKFADKTVGGANLLSPNSKVANTTLAAPAPVANTATGASDTLTTNFTTGTLDGPLQIDTAGFARINSATVIGAFETKGSISFMGGVETAVFTSNIGNNSCRAGLSADMLGGSGGGGNFSFMSAADLLLTISFSTIHPVDDDIFALCQLGANRFDPSHSDFDGASVGTKLLSGVASSSGNATGSFADVAVVPEYLMMKEH